MAYGITSSSQLIDLNTIRTGCQKFKAALDDFEICGETVIRAGETCSKKALSIDDASMQYMITESGVDIQKLKTTLSIYADQLLADATNVYNAQVAELNEYIKSLNNN